MDKSPKTQAERRRRAEKKEGLAFFTVVGGAITDEGLFDDVIDQAWLDAMEKYGVSPKVGNGEG